MSRWSVKIRDISYGGLAPSYYAETYPSYGNVNQAGDCVAIDMTNPGYILPGPALVVYPGGASAITTTIRSFTNRADSASQLYGIGGAKIYQINAAASAVVLHTISATSASIYLDDIATYGDSMFYSWRTATGLVNVGKWVGGTLSYDDDWWTNTVSATALQSISGGQYRPPLTFEVGRNDVLYFSNGRYVASYDGSTAQDKALDLPQNSEIKDIAWLGDRLYISAVYSQYGVPYSSIYIWDGTTNSWEAEVPVAGYVGASHVSNGTFYQFYYERNGSNKLARLEGNSLVDLVSYPGTTPPEHFQVTEFNGFFLWCAGVDSDDIYAWGSGSIGEPARLFHFVSTGATTGKAGGIFNAMEGTGVLVAKNDQLYYLDSLTTETYQTGSSWKSLIFDVTKDTMNGGRIDTVRFNFEKLTGGEVLSWSIENNQGVTLYQDKISYAKATASPALHTLTTALYNLNGKITENFRICLDYSTGSSTAPVKVKSIQVYGNS